MLYFFDRGGNKSGEYKSKSNVDCVKCPLGWKRSDADTVDLTKCIQCKLGETTTMEGATTCSGCDLGTYGSSKGECNSCPIGRYKDGKGEGNCTECDIDTYLNEQGKSSKADCNSCDGKRTTGEITGAASESSCVCKKDDYYQDYQNEESTCVACPIGAKCFENGIALPFVYPDVGYWRANNKTDVFTDCSSSFSSDPNALESARKRCCPVELNESVCKDLTFAEPNKQCLRGYQGPLCAGKLLPLNLNLVLHIHVF